MGHTYASIYYHIVFATQGRVPALGEQIRPRLWDYMGGILRNIRCHPVIVGGHAEHAHVVVSAHQDLAPSKLVATVKANSSRWLHETYPDLAEICWQRGGSVYTLHHGLVERARQYVSRQEEHHREQSFEEEYRAFLRRHGVVIDERYIWD